MTASVVAAGTAVASPGFDPVRHAWSDAEHRALHGTWVAAAGVRDGVPLMKTELASICVTFHGPQYRPYSGFADLTNLIDDPTPRATRFLVLPWTSSNNFEVCRRYGWCETCSHGLYERSGDTLRLCMSSRLHRASPAVFAAPAGSGLILLTMTRER